MKNKVKKSFHFFFFAVRDSSQISILAQAQSFSDFAVEYLPAAVLFFLAQLAEFRQQGRNVGRGWRHLGQLIEFHESVVDLALSQQLIPLIAQQPFARGLLLGHRVNGWYGGTLASDRKDRDEQGQGQNADQ